MVRLIPATSRRIHLRVCITCPSSSRQQPLEVAEIHRLHQMVVEPRGGEIAGSAAIAGEGDQERAVVSRSSPNTPCQLVTVDPGEPDVSDHDVGAEALEDV